MAGRTPWYLVPRTMGRWQLRMLSMIYPFFGLALGFIGGWSVVHLPGRDGFKNAPTPAWLLWAGLGFAAATVLAYASARLTSPVYDSDHDTPSENPKPEPSGCLRGLTLVVAVDAALVVCAVVSTSSRHRWHPIILLGVVSAVGPLIAFQALRRSA